MWRIRSNVEIIPTSENPVLCSPSFSHGHLTYASYSQSSSWTASRIVHTGKFSLQCVQQWSVSLNALFGQMSSHILYTGKVSFLDGWDTSVYSGGICCQTSSYILYICEPSNHCGHEPCVSARGILDQMSSHILYTGKVSLLDGWVFAAKLHLTFFTFVSLHTLMDTSHVSLHVGISSKVLLTFFTLIGL